MVVVVVVVMMMMVVMMPPPDHDVMVMMVMMVVTELNRKLRDFGCRPLGGASILGFQHRDRIGNRIKKIPVTCRPSELWRLRRRGLSGRHCC